MEKKMTYAQALEVAINTVTNDEVKERLTALKASLQKKAENKKPTKVQAENENVKNVILTALTDKGQTVTDIMNSNETLKALSNQKVSALLRQLIESGEVVKTVDKKKSYFSLTTVEVEQ